MNYIQYLLSCSWNSSLHIVCTDSKLAKPGTCGKVWCVAMVLYVDVLKKKETKQKQSDTEEPQPLTDK